MKKNSDVFFLKEKNTDDYSGKPWRLLCIALIDSSKCLPFPVLVISILSILTIYGYLYHFDLAAYSVFSAYIDVSFMCMVLKRLIYWMLHALI